MAFKLATAFLVLSSFFAASVLGYPSSEASNGREQSILEKAYSVVRDCGDKDITLCLKMRALTYVDKALRRSDSIEILDGVSLVKAENSGDVYRELSGRALSLDELDNSLPKDEEEKDSQVENMLFDRVTRFLRSHTLQLRVPESSLDDMKRSMDEARGKQKKAKKILPYILLALIWKKMFAAKVAFVTLKLLAFKALVIGKLALVMSLIIALHKLLAHKQHSQTYEVVAHPHHSEEHSHYSGRSISADPQQLAYNAYVPNKLD